MKKILSFLCVAALLISIAGCKKKSTEIDMNSIYLLGFSKYDRADAYLGNSASGSVTFKVAVKIDAATIAEKGNKKVLGVRCDLGSTAMTGKVFMAYELGNNVAEKNFTFTEGGCQYVLFDAPMDINEGADIYVGYEATGTGYFMGTEYANSTLYKNSYIYDDGSWKTFKNAGITTIYGASIQAICVGGDYASEKQHDVVVENITFDNEYPRCGEKVQFTAEVRNAGVRTTGTVKVTCKYGDVVADGTVTNLRNGESKLLTYTINGITTEMNKITIEVAEDGVTDEKTTNNKVTGELTVYAQDAPERKFILIEQFTGQDCGYCPDGISNMREAIAGMTHPEKAAWIAHHSGYTDDIFTVTGDKKIASALGVQGAPSCSYNRLKVKEPGSSTAELVNDPRSATSAFLDQLAAMPANATINMNVSLNKGDSTLAVTVNGMTYSHDNSYITVILCQDSLIARQSSGGNNFVHNETVRYFMTADLGDKLTVDESTGDYTATYTYKIPAAISGVKGTAIATNFKNMFVVAFVHGKTSNQGSVYNADKAYIYTVE